MSTRWGRGRGVMCTRWRGRGRGVMCTRWGWGGGGGVMCTRRGGGGGGGGGGVMCTRCRWGEGVIHVFCILCLCSLRVLKGRQPECV